MRRASVARRGTSGNAMRLFLAFTLLVTIACSDARTQPLPPGARADQVVVDKSERRLSLYANGRVLKTYRVALGPDPMGHKQREGDGRTPEGNYVIDYRNPQSRFYRSLHISYPSAADRRAARRRGVSPGGDIMIHGLPNGLAAVGSAHTRNDWTAGCIAVTNDEIDEIWRAAQDGTPIVITR